MHRSRRSRQAIRRRSGGSPSSSPSWDDLPDDCWASIFALLDDLYEHGPVSLVCKRFLTITNNLRTDFTLSFYLTPYPPPFALSSRFPNLHTFRLLYHHPSIGRFLRHLAVSGIPLRSLTLSRQTHFPRTAMRRLGRSRVSQTLKYFRLRIASLTDGDLFIIAKCFSYIQHLVLERCQKLYDCGVYEPYVQGSLTDEGIRAIAISLTSLVSFEFHCLSNLSHRSFEYLSSNCPLLSDVKVYGLPIEAQCFHSFASLTSLELQHMIIAEDGHDLEVLAAANLKLRKLSLSYPVCGRVNGVSMCRFLKSCRSLTDLFLTFFVFSPDTYALDFAASIPNVQVIRLTRCICLPERLLFNLLMKCPHLEQIDIHDTPIGTLKSSFTLGMRKGLRELSLGPYVGLYDQTLVDISTICPNLESVSIRHICEISKKGVNAFIANCPNIKHLSSFDGVNHFIFDK